MVKRKLEIELDGDSRNLELVCSQIDVILVIARKELGVNGKVRETGK